MVCRLFGAELSFLSYQTNIQTEPFRKSSMKIELEHITIKWNTLENVASKTVHILYWPQCVKGLLNNQIGSQRLEPKYLVWRHSNDYIYKKNSTSVNFLHNVRNWRQLFVTQIYIPTIYRKMGQIKSSHLRLTRNESSKICIIFLLWWESTDNQCIAFMSVQVDISPSWQDYYSIVLLLVSICFEMNHYKRISPVCPEVSSSLVLDFFHRRLQRLPDNNREITLWYAQWIGLR